MKTLLLLSEDASLIEIYGQVALEEGLALVLSDLQRTENLPPASQVGAVLFDAGSKDATESFINRIQHRYQHHPLIYLVQGNMLEARLIALDHGFHLIIDKESPRELQSRQLRNILRFSNTHNEQKPEKRNIRKCLGLEIDVSRYSARSETGLLPLTKTEFTLLEVLSREPGIPVTHDALSDALWGWDSDTYGAHLKCHISRLRSKLIDAQTGANIISLRGRGYSLAERES